MSPCCGICSRNMEDEKLCRFWWSNEYWKLHKLAKLFCKHGIRESRRAWSLALLSIILGQGIFGLHLLWSDVSEPTKNVFLRGMHYFIAFVDDLSWRVWVYNVHYEDKRLSVALSAKRWLKLRLAGKLSGLDQIMMEKILDSFIWVCQFESIVLHSQNTPLEWDGWTHELNFARESSLHVVQSCTRQAILGQGSNVCVSLFAISFNWRHKCLWRYGLEDLQMIMLPCIWFHYILSCEGILVGS